MSTEDIRQSIESTARHFAEHPDEACSVDRAVTAVLEQGLRCRVTAAGTPFELFTDMSKALGGGAAAPSPGWLSRAALASCDATVIAMRAAQAGIELQALEVTVESDSDNRGLLGVGEEAPAGPLQVRVHVRLGAEGVSRERLLELVAWAERHSPVGDEVRRAIPTSVEVEVVETTRAS
jgi:uncharacterized OsmC-like protein